MHLTLSWLEPPVGERTVASMVWFSITLTRAAGGSLYPFREHPSCHAGQLLCLLVFAVPLKSAIKTSLPRWGLSRFAIVINVGTLTMFFLNQGKARSHSRGSKSSFELIQREEQ